MFSRIRPLTSAINRPILRTYSKRHEDDRDPAFLLPLVLTLGGASIVGAYHILGFVIETANSALTETSEVTTLFSNAYNKREKMLNNSKETPPTNQQIDGACGPEFAFFKQKLEKENPNVQIQCNMR